MPRIYTMKFEGVSVGAVQDLLAIYTGTKTIIVHEVVIGQVTITTAANLALSMKTLSGTITNGTGGSAGTIVPMNASDAAATVTGRTNDTTQASATTTAVHRADVYNIVNAYDFLPPREDRPIVGPSSVFVVSLDTAPTSQTTSATIVFEEIP